MMVDPCDESSDRLRAQLEAQRQRRKDGVARMKKSRIAQEASHARVMGFMSAPPAPPPSSAEPSPALPPTARVEYSPPPAAPAPPESDVSAECMALIESGEHCPSECPQCRRVLAQQTRRRKDGIKRLRQAASDSDEFNMRSFRKNNNGAAAAGG